MKHACRDGLALGRRQQREHGQPEQRPGTATAAPSTVSRTGPSRDTVMGGEDLLAGSDRSGAEDLLAGSDRSGAEDLLAGTDPSTAATLWPGPRGGRRWAIRRRRFRHPGNRRSRPGDRRVRCRIGAVTVLVDLARARRRVGVRRDRALPGRSGTVSASPPGRAGTAGRSPQIVTITDITTDITVDSIVDGTAEAAVAAEAGIAIDLGTVEAFAGSRPISRRRTPRRAGPRDALRAGPLLDHRARRKPATSASLAAADGLHQRYLTERPALQPLPGTWTTTCGQALPADTREGAGARRLRAGRGGRGWLRTPGCGMGQRGPTRARLRERRGHRLGRAGSADGDVTEGVPASGRQLADAAVAARCPGWSIVSRPAAGCSTSDAVLARLPACWPRRSPRSALQFDDHKDSIRQATAAALLQSALGRPGDLPGRQRDGRADRRSVRRRVHVRHAARPRRPGGRPAHGAGGAGGGRVPRHRSNPRRGTHSRTTCTPSACAGTPRAPSRAFRAASRRKSARRSVPRPDRPGCSRRSAPRGSPRRRLRDDCGVQSGDRRPPLIPAQGCQSGPAAPRRRPPGHTRRLATVLATASLIACSVPARSLRVVGTSTTRMPPGSASASASSSDVVTRTCSAPTASTMPARVTPCGVPKTRSKAPGSSGRPGSRCRRWRPVVVAHHDHQVRPRFVRADHEAGEVVQEVRSPISATVGAPTVDERDADRRGTVPSMPATPRFATMRNPSRAAAPRRRLAVPVTSRAPASRRPGSSRDEIRCQAGRMADVEVPQHLSDSHRRRPVSAFRQRAAHAGPAVRDVGQRRRDGPGVADRVGESGRAGATTSTAMRGSASSCRHRPEQCRSAEHDHPVRARRVEEIPMPSRWMPAPVPTRRPRRRLRRSPGARRRRCPPPTDASGRRRTAPAHRRPAAATRAASASTDDPCPRATAPGKGFGPARPLCTSAGSGSSGSASGTFELDRTGDADPIRTRPRPPGRPSTATQAFRPAPPAALRTHGTSADAGPNNRALVDGLVRADVRSHGRPVRGEHQQRTPP